MFDVATRKKLRFPMRKGMISCEDLWDLSLDDLDRLAIDLKKTLDEREVSFIKTPRVSNTDDQLRFNIVKSIIDVKLQEKEIKEDRVKKEAEKVRIQALIAEKENEKLKDTSLEELKKKLMELDS